MFTEDEIDFMWDKVEDIKKILKYRNAQMKKQKKENKIIDLSSKENMKKIRSALMKDRVVDESKYDTWIENIEFDSLF